MSKTQEQPSTQPTIHEFFEAVRNHPDFVFGTIFTIHDFSEREHAFLRDFLTYDAEDSITFAGNIFIEESGFRPSFYDDNGIDEEEEDDEDEDIIIEPMP